MNKSDETALDMFIQSQRLSENEWRKRLAFELCKAYQDGWAAASEKAKRMVGYCDCEITLDQDGVDHVLHEISVKIEALAKEGK